MIAWKDKNGKSYYMHELTDVHLMNILNGIKNKTLNLPEDLVNVVANLCEEAAKRCLISNEDAHYIADTFEGYIVDYGWDFSND